MLASLAAGALDIEDLLGCRVHGQLDEWVRGGGISTFDERCREQLDRIVPALAPWRAGAFSVAQFHAWFRRRIGRPFPVAASWCELGRTVPRWSHLLVERVLRLEARLRMLHLARVLAAALETRERVLIVGAARHHAALRAVLARMLGSPRIVEGLTA